MIMVPGKIQANLLHTGNQRFIRGFLFRLIVVCSSGQFHQFAPPFNTLEEGAVFGNELCFFSACLRLLRTAFFKNSFSSVTLPSSLSSSRTRASRWLPGMVPDPVCRWHIVFPSAKLTGSDVVTPAQISRSGRLTEQLLNNRSFEILSEPSSFNDRVLSPPFKRL